MNNKFTKTFFFLLAFVLITKAGFVFAASGGDEIKSMVVGFFNWGITTGILLSGAVFAYGAVHLLIDYAKGHFLEEGKTWMKAGLFGLVLTLSLWLIINTINPDILNIKTSLFKLNTLNTGGNNGGNPLFQPKILNYNEIPLGKLTENVLSKKIACYEFDTNGDPIAGDILLDKKGKPVKDDKGNPILGPTYLEHDRADCYLKISEATEKKALMAEQLSKEIEKLMEQCKCETYGNCEDPCNKSGDGCKLGPGGGGCVGTCKNPMLAGCELPPVLKNKPSKETSLSCCPADIKEKIKGYKGNNQDDETMARDANGDPIKKKHQGVQPFELPAKKECNNCSDGITRKFYGLDEFYTNKSSIINDVEKKVTVDEKEIKYIDLDGCKSCLDNCQCETGDQNCIQNQPRCQQEKQKCLSKDRPKCLLTVKWGQLNIIEQLKYLKEKQEELKKTLEDDLKEMRTAGSNLSKCSLSKSYMDLREVDNSVDGKTTILKISPGKEEIGKYCGGFNYQNSECYQKCSDMCPLAPATLSCYGTCAQNNPCVKPVYADYNLESSYNRDMVLYKKCIVEQEKCMTKCYEQNPCKNSQDYPNFKKCMTTCTNSCQTLCTVKYATCSEDFKLCQAQCDNNSKCVLGNLGSCLYDPGTISKCNSITDEDDRNYCISNLYKCKSGSEQNSGYPECLKEPLKEDNFSSSYIWQNQSKQVCIDALIKKGFYNKAGQVVTCAEANPQTAKCPAASFCPDCPCNTIDYNVKFDIEDEHIPVPPLTCEEKEAIANGEFGGRWDPNTYSCSTQESIVAKEYKLVGPDCNQTMYNDDPLTFYCRQDWWNEPETKRQDAIGNTMRCSPSKEIPVGMTVNDTGKWADKFIEKSQKIIESTSTIIEQLDKLGKATNFCQCNSKFETGMPVCMACCIYIKPKGFTPPVCIFQSCAGNSCQQMIDWLWEVQNKHIELKNKYLDLLGWQASEPRTDILKELTYSRNQINTCSASQNLTSGDITKLLDCQKVLDDIIPAFTDAENKIYVNKKEIYHYCKGQMEGKIFKNGDTIDNWFCCEKVVPLTKLQQVQQSADAYTKAIMGH